MMKYARSKCEKWSCSMSQTATKPHQHLPQPQWQPQPQPTTSLTMMAMMTLSPVMRMAAPHHFPLQDQPHPLHLHPQL